MDHLRIGTSGWSYPSGRGTWNGVFYPRGRKTDELRFYSERFDTVEINSSFYRPPSPSVTRKWVERTPPAFEFSLKLYQKFTHPRMYRKSSGREDVSVRQSDFDEFRAGIEPIARAGKLGALLAQFPASFRKSSESVDHLVSLLRAFREYPVAVELRHKSWSDTFGETLVLLNEHGAAWTQIDEPKFKFSIRQNYLPNVTTFYYMRLHGRNWQHWWKHEKMEDRYDYLYSEKELQPFADTAGAAKELVKKLYLYLNNHFAAKSVANALMLKQALGQPIPNVPPELVKRYPELKEIVPAHRVIREDLLSAVEDI